MGTDLWGISSLIIGILVFILLPHEPSPYTPENVPSGSSKAPSQTALILGGRGQQGRGAIDYLLKEGEGKWKIRTITRNAASAKDLAALGVEVIEGEPYDRKVLSKALSGVEAVFGITFSDFEGGKEVSEGRVLADAVKDAQVNSFVFSGGEETPLPSLNAKHEIEQYVRSLSIPFTVFLHTCFFYENLVAKGGQTRVQEEKEGEGLIFSTPLPGALEVPMISAYDIGRIAGAAILHPERFNNGEAVPIVGDIVSGQHFVDTYQRISGSKASYRTMSLEEFEQKEIPGAKAIAGMYRWYMEGGHNRTTAATKKLFPEVQDLSTWMKNYGVEWINQQARV